jgi:hypothetical protein
MRRCISLEEGLATKLIKVSGLIVSHIVLGTYYLHTTSLHATHKHMTHDWAVQPEVALPRTRIREKTVSSEHCYA